MTRNDFEHCAQAYQFAELLLGGFHAKPLVEQEHAITAARRLRDEVEAPYERVVASAGAGAAAAAEAAKLSAARARLDDKLAQAARNISG